MQIIHHAQPQFKRSGSKESMQAASSPHSPRSKEGDEPGSTARALLSPRLVLAPRLDEETVNGGHSSNQHNSSAWPQSPAVHCNREAQEIMLIPPEDSVYSYVMFMPPIEQRRNKKKVTPLIVFAVLLVIVNFIMQTGLLYVVGQHIMKNHNEWVSKLANLKHTAWYHVIPMHYNRAPPKCHGQDSPLCLNSGDGISCAPRSVEVLADWNFLDIDGDEIWSREEAENKELQETVQCKFNVDLLSLYDATVMNMNSSHFLRARQDTNLKTGVGIHKAYRDWYLHRPLLCQYGDQDMCGLLFTRGFFDEALRQQSSIEFKDTASAFKYCNQLLQKECFDILPNTYRVWRLVANQQCGAKQFGQSNYRSPAEEEQSKGTPMLTVDFKKRVDYDSSRRLEFKLFLVILLVTFSSVMSLEMRSILKTFIWCRKFPTDEEADRDNQIVGRDAVKITRADDDDDDEETASRMKSAQYLKPDGDVDELSSWTVQVLKVRRDHRMLVFVITVFRLCLWFFLLWSGVMFLTGPPRYLALIFDALSLVFIFEIDELLYRTMLRTEFKNDHMNVKDLKVPRSFVGHVGVLQDISLFLLVIAFSTMIVVTYSIVELDPLVDSLECLCTSQGAKCKEANLYSKSWWDTYWSTTMPAAAMIIDQLKEI